LEAALVAVDQKNIELRKIREELNQVQNDLELQEDANGMTPQNKFQTATRVVYGLDSSR
jgi:hypothetical protein